MKPTTKAAIIELMSGSLDEYELRGEGVCVLKKPLDITEKASYIPGVTHGGLGPLNAKKSAILSSFAELKIPAKDSDVYFHLPSKSAEITNPQNFRRVCVNLKIFDGLSEDRMDSLRDFVSKKERESSGLLDHNKDEKKGHRGKAEYIHQLQLKKCQTISEDLGPKKSIEPPKAPPSEPSDEGVRPRKSI